jgi:CRISPR-associated endonuclease/helicase Cas3
VKPAGSRIAFLEFWGKARPPADRPSPSWHPVAYHLLDVAAATEAILEARPVALQRAARLLRLEEEDARRLLVTLAGLHDLGKFAPAFQAQVPDLWDDLRAKLCLSEPIPGRHTEDGFALWVDEVAESLGERIWPGARRALEVIAPAIFGHHGRPTLYLAHRCRQGFPGLALAAARVCADAVVELLCPEPIPLAAPDAKAARIASWYIAGLMTTADWIGSGVGWFRYTEPMADDPGLARYWNEVARPSATRAVREAGMLAPPSAPRRPFREVACLDRNPTPLQRWAESVPLPGTPCLVVVEDVTGAGKTEAAQMLVHRLLAAGRAAGAYWAMPTQATANAMYGRQARMLDGLFAAAADPRPSLVLAHGQQRLHAGFRDTVLPGATDARDDSARNAGEIDDELPGTAACAAFLADDRRAALLADVGAGTIDQALLGVLPSRFNTVRLFGLADKVLVVDEAHAYDAYMSTELEQLLRFQAALGGCAVVLSATLPQAKRADLADAWLDGLRLGGWSDGSAASPAAELRADAYPLATLVSGDGVHEAPLDTAEWSRRSVAIRWLHEPEDAIAHATAMAAAGAAVAWVRNTVDDCLAAAEALRQRGVEKVIVFHARFAQADRQAREKEVLERFGQDASAEQRAGWVLVATQVVEQSLDLDFDVMLSDLAPIDLLVQRAGRLWRHVARDGSRPAGCALELVVLSPPRSSDPPEGWLGGAFRGTAAVYRNHGVLWRTVEALSDAGSIETPGGLRALVEAVYGAQGEVPDALLESTQRAEAESLSAASTAQYGTLKVTHGYDAGQQPWVDDLRVPTRLGDETTTIRLARVRPDGGLAPWATVQPAWRAWALSEVRVRANRIPPNAAPSHEHAAAADVARRDWGRYEQDLPIVPLREVAPGTYQGALVSLDWASPIHLRYSLAEGLAYPAKY